MYNSTNTISTINVHEASTFLRRKKVACLKQYDKTHCIHHCFVEGGRGGGGGGAKSSEETHRTHKI